MKEFKLTISNCNVFMWQDQDYLGDVTITVNKQELDVILPILLENNCYVVVNGEESKLNEIDS